MSGRVRIDADLNFVKDVIQAGGGDLKKCYQCSTCTVVCPLTPEGAPFPRKEMIHGQWGIKDKLIKSMDPWLCFNCNDCSEQCPRGAKPGDVMAAIRSMIIQNIAAPSFIAKSAKTIGGAFVLLLLPLIVIGMVILAIHGTGLKFVEKKDIIFSQMLSVTQVDLIFVPTALFAVITAFLGVKTLINNIKEHHPIVAGKGMPLLESFKETIADILLHKQFKECGPNQSRNTAHMMLVYGFIGLFFTTTGVVLIHYGHVFGLVDYDTPLPFSHPMKILGNMSAVAASLGILLIMGRRLFSEQTGKATAFDWIFIADVFLVILTGVLAQLTRTYELKVAYLIYYFHLVFIFFLFAYAPHSKFGHMFYRTAALVYAKYSGRGQSGSVDNPKTKHLEK